jgi:hypothetical protein
MRDKIEDIQIWTPNYLINLTIYFLLHCSHHSTIQLTQTKIQINHMLKQQTLAQRSSSQKRFYRSR